MKRGRKRGREGVEEKKLQDSKNVNPSSSSSSYKLSHSIL